MHAKRSEVTRFLDSGLLPQIKYAFALYKSTEKADLVKELAKTIDQAQALGADPETLPKVKELRAKIANEAVDIGGLENEVYDHLFSFFRRYYSDGDFLAKRVYKPGVYAIPYEGGRASGMEQHWLIIERLENWKADCENGFSFFGLPPRYKSVSSIIRSGDKVYCYVSSGIIPSP
jgi:hypothetical protein